MCIDSQCMSGASKAAFSPGKNSAKFACTAAMSVVSHMAYSEEGVVTDSSVSANYGEACQLPSVQARQELSHSKSTASRRTNQAEDDSNDGANLNNAARAHTGDLHGANILVVGGGAIASTCKQAGGQQQHTPCLAPALGHI